ncbi:MAG TPA: DUF4249 family protein, partial [Chitinophagaceae bacterium]|nr:DUF4249 family protein [Chitinophagaceae bacterium]
MKNSISIVFISLLFTSCEKTVDLKYKDNQSRIIIEGNITNEPGPYFVKITKSTPLSDIGSYPTVDNAVVSISDNAGNSEMLTSEGNGMYRTNTLEGVTGRTYSLIVNAENQAYTAQSSMPQPVLFDSIKVEQFTFGGDIERNIIPIYTDPIAKGNNYRFVLWVNNKLINQHFVQNDEVTNGVVNTMRLEIDDNTVTLKAGDLITLKMQCMDKKAALYYTTLALMGDSGPGGGTTPNNPPTNMTNGALGVFSA